MTLSEESTEGEDCGNSQSLQLEGTVKGVREEACFRAPAP